MAIVDLLHLNRVACGVMEPFLARRERPEGIAAGTARLVGTDKDRIVSEIYTLLDDSTAYASMARAHNPFGDGKAGEYIAEIVARAG